MSRGNAIATGTVSLVHAKDSSLVKVAITDKSGEFEFINIHDGNYLLAATSVGFAKVYSAGIQISGADIKMPAWH